MQKILKLFNNSEIRLYFLLLLLAVLGYGLVIPQLGLYGDDPAFLSIYHFVGPFGYQNYLGWFRPFAPWIYLLITPLLGEHIWAYHLLLLFLRWASTILFYQLAKTFWPKKTTQLAWAACLLILYPGFRQPAMPLEFSLHFATLCLYLISCWLMVTSILKPRYYIVLTLGALISGLGLFGIEYFTGLEFLRPLMLAFIIWRLDSKHWLKKALLYEIPYLVLFAGYLAWRLVFLKTGYYQPTVVSSISTSPLPVLLQMISKAFKDLLTSGVLAWTDIYRLPGSGSALWIYLGIFLITAAAVFFHFKKEQQLNLEPEKTEKWGWTFLVIGIIVMIAGGIPLWSAGLPVELTYPWDRTTLPFMLGACISLAALIEIFFKPKYQPVVLALFAAVLVGFNFQVQNTYKKEWDITSRYFWQLAWRAPQIKPGTLILTDQLPFTFYPDNSLTPLLNWTYDPANHTGKDTYKYFNLSARRDSYLSSLNPDTPVEHGDFSGNTSQTLVLYATPATCLRILTPGDEAIPKLSQNLIDSMALTQLDLITADPAKSAAPPLFMGKEPAHDWCYYFSKAELAAQQQDWAQVVKLDEEAAAKSLGPSAYSETIVFIKAYYHVNNINRAVELSQTALARDPDLRPYLCTTWKNLDASGSSSQVSTLISSLKCP